MEKLKQILMNIMVHTFVEVFLALGPWGRLYPLWQRNPLGELLVGKDQLHSHPAMAHYVYNFLYV